MNATAQVMVSFSDPYWLLHVKVREGDATPFNFWMYFHAYTLIPLQQAAAAAQSAKRAAGIP